MSDEIEDLKRQIAALTERVSRLEGAPVSHPSPPPPRPVSVPDHAPKVSLENRIGVQLFNRVGILAVLIGAAWFLKFAIDNQWVGPLARVLIGIGAGSGIILWSERFRAQGYRGFSLSLKAIGTGILYLSLWAAYALFHLLPAPVAFFAMILVTAWNAWMSWSQSSQALAFYAAVGGFLTPLLLSNGENHELALFGYLLVLDLAIFALVLQRPWLRLLPTAFLATAFYEFAWAMHYYSGVQFALSASLLAILFLFFSIAPLVVRIIEAPQADLLAALSLANAAAGYLGFFLLLDAPNGAAPQAIAAILFAAYFLALRIAMERLDLPNHFAARSRVLNSAHLLAAIGFMGVALALAIHFYWWQVRYTGDRSLIHDYRTYAQFTYSAAFMAFGGALLMIGFFRRSAFLRWQALFLLTATIAKVFLIDISQLSQGYRIFSFLGLGVLLLAVSFAYQKDWLSLRGGIGEKPAP
ncbi:DUF2339 domain-containing protein [Silvibacterium acidisoli]|uniref:DUF2339 domain-containing protein n=1 Tax=Acidobacteriaceae bacterium ZG23-2 TaxID=2883246 RepID=UPI00406D24B5